MMTQRFESAVNKLIKAFFDETLTKGKCNRCAVGNICGSREWSLLFMTQVETGIQIRHGLDVSKDFPKLYEEALDVINQTGYSPEELAQVEHVFETNTEFTALSYKDGKCTYEELIQDQFNGLCAVIDVLCEFEGENPEIYKDKLREKPEVQV